MSKLEADFNTLIISIASSVILSLGLEKNPQTDKFEKNLDIARYNIDLLIILKEKTKGNLSTHEENYLNAIITDLQLKFVQAK
ncbi:MAG: DUF1844 domain-containing protein [Bdellovibrionota bacterium]